jgi:outer membrane immunogenic protein
MEDRMKKFLLAGVALSALLGGSAGAADLARPVPVYAPPPVFVPLFTWTGCYVGGNGGGIWASNDWNDSFYGDYGNNTASGGIGGLQGGCNYQVGAWVFGLQGDYDWTSINNTSANPVLSNLTGLVITDQTQIKSLASVTGRVGYSWDRFLAYVKAGGAWMQGSYAFQVAGVPVATASQTQSGWTVGVGGEYAFLNWLTGFVEYDYYGFNSNNNSGLLCTPTVCTGPVGAVALSNGTGVKDNVSVLKVGLNFKFGPGGF